MVQKFADGDPAGAGALEVGQIDVNRAVEREPSSTSISARVAVKALVTEAIQNRPSGAQV
jgi:hypothetical protein